MALKAIGRISQDKVLVLSLLVYFSFLGSLWGLYRTGSPKHIKITVYDAIAKAGEEIVLAVKLENDGPGPINPDLKKQPTRVVLSDPRSPQVPLHEEVVTTDGDGVARVRVTAPARVGFYPILARPEGKAFKARRHQPAGLWVLPGDRPLLVCDIDDTVTQGESHKLFIPGQEPKPHPGAARELDLLTERYNVVFLTARDDSLLDSTRAWLARHGFPRCAVAGRDWNVLSPLRTGKDKEKVLKSWRDRFGAIAWGVGNSEGDRHAYTAVGAPHVILRPGETDPAGNGEEKGVPEYFARNWTEIGQLIRDQDEKKKKKP